MAQLRDGIYGLAVADALGVPYEFKKRGTFTCKEMVGFGTWNQEAGTWSDDTSMTLATCKSIRDKGCIDLEDIRKNFESWLYKGAFTAHGETFDVGNTTQEAISLGHGLDDFYSNGNGSLMRILPLAFTGATDQEIRDVSALTHGHEIAQKACVDYIHIARKLMAGEGLGLKMDQEEDQIESSGFVLHTLEASLWCLARTSSYKEAVLKAINLGDDTDTTGAVTGGLAGIIYGYEAIPKDWIDQLKNKDLIEECLF